MTPVMYGSSYVYYLVSSSGKLGIADGTPEQWASVNGSTVEVWFEDASNSSNNGSVNVGDTVYIHANGRDGVDRVLVKRIVGDTMQWALVRDGDGAGVASDGIDDGQPLPVGATVTFSYSDGYIGLGADDYVALTGTALPFVPTMTS